MNDIETDNPLWGPGWGDVRRLWSLDPRVAHLNHGSYGAVPVRVRQVQDAFRAEADDNPERWFRRRAPGEVVDARAAVARFLGAAPDAVALVRNASAGVSAALANVPLAQGDEIILTNHAYGAVRLAVKRKCGETGGVPVIAPIRAGAQGDEILASLERAVTERTRLIVVDHVSSDTAMLFPVADIVEKAHARGIRVLVDGAHAPGMLDVDLGKLGPDFWVGNLHKWCCAPHGTAVLYVAERYRAGFRTLETGAWDEAGFPRSFDYTGTMDFTSWLAAPAALALLGDIGWERVRRYNNALCETAQGIVAVELGVEGSSLWGDPALSMRVVPLPASLVPGPEQARALQARLATEFGLETVVKMWEARGLVRLSAHVYNTLPQYEKLAHVLGRLARAKA
jgi:isopenicillin-N epimerase